MTPKRMSTEEMLLWCQHAQDGLRTAAKGAEIVWGDNLAAHLKNEADALTQLLAEWKQMREALEFARVYFEYECQGNLTLSGRPAEDVVLERIRAALPREEDGQHG